MKICYLSPPYTDLSFENQLLRGTDIELVASVVKNSDDARRAAKDADAILTAVVPVDANLIDDLANCRKKGIQVCNVPDYGTEEVANHAMALLFAVHRRILSYDRNVRNHRWGHVLPWPIHRLSTLRVGVVGLGRIGSTFARFVKPFVRDVVGFDPFLTTAQFATKGLERISLESLFESSDIISLHLPLSEESRHLISAGAIVRMKRSPIIVNVSRGGLIDGGALAQALESGKPSGAGIDVFEEEPRARPGLLRFENIVLTPHVAWYSEEADLQLRRSAIEEIIRVLTGHSPKNPV